MRLLIILVVLGAVAALPFLLWGDVMATLLDGRAAIAWLQQFGALAGLVGVALLIGDIVLPLPASGVMAALGVLYGPIVGSALASLGNFLSGQLAYTLCRQFGQPAATWFLGKDKLARFSARFERIGMLAVAGSRALPLLPEITSFAAGLMGMDWRRFSIALAAGSIVTGSGFAILGHLGRGQPTLVIGIAIALPPIFLLLVGRRFMSR